MNHNQIRKPGALTVDFLLDVLLNDAVSPSRSKDNATRTSQRGPSPSASTTLEQPPTHSRAYSHTIIDRFELLDTPRRNGKPSPASSSLVPSKYKHIAPCWFADCTACGIGSSVVPCSAPAVSSPLLPSFHISTPTRSHTGGSSWLRTRLYLHSVP